IPRHDILTGGFPCQPFSSAGKKQGIKDARGTLFEIIVRILNKHRPRFFVLENVKRLLSMDKGDHFATILQSLVSVGYTVEWRLLNAINFGLPQNRERVIIIGTLNKQEASYLCPMEDLHNVRYRRSNLKRTVEFLNWGVVLGNSVCQANPTVFSEKKGDVKLYEILESNPSKRFFFTEDTKERIKNSVRVNRFYNNVEILYNQKGGARTGYSIFGTSGVAPTLTCTASRHYERYKIGEDYRRLTNIEYARIQGFPDNHCEGIPLNKQYRLYGNAVPPQIVLWAINRLIERKTFHGLN
ncbi:MAG TPA: DNA (cytosine-5-)-methyltransferase, partial [Balneola sp.]|nr:DNA (cytosine-5-)-methyltransferase [Balneola sp.]